MGRWVRLCPNNSNRKEGVTSGVAVRAVKVEFDPLRLRWLIEAGVDESANVSRNVG